MNGINKITSRIAAEAGDELAAIKAETQQKCREIKAEYDQKAQDEYWRIMQAGAQDGELQAKRLSGAAMLEAKKSVLSMKQDGVTKVLDSVVERITMLPKEVYVAFLAKQAFAATTTGTEEIIFNANDKASCAKEVVKTANEMLKKSKRPDKLTVSSTVGNFRGGLIVKQGDIEANCCVETLLEINRDKLASPIAEILFAE